MKKKMLFYILCVSLFMLLFVSTLLWLTVNNNHKWKHTADFDKYKSEFIIVADYVLKENSTGYRKWFFVSITDSYGRTLFDPDKNNYVELPVDVRESLETICDYGFPNKDSVLDVIRILRGRVSFCIENGRYALVYSPNEKPTWLDSPDEDRTIEVKKIEDGWYHVIESPK